MKGTQYFLSIPTIIFPFGLRYSNNTSDGIQYSTTISGLLRAKKEVFFQKPKTNTIFSTKILDHYQKLFNKKNVLKSIKI